MITNNPVIRVLFLFLLLLSNPVDLMAQEYKSVKDIPNPKVAYGGSVSNPDGIFSTTETDSLNLLINAMQAQTGVETAVVIVNDFEEAEDEFNFAVKLFREWGIGKKRSDNGLLLFIATNRRQYRFITGYGLEGLLSDGDLKLIGERYLVPAFKEKEYGQGTIKAISIITAYLKQPANHKELAQLLNKNTRHAVDWYQPAIICLLLIGVYIAVRRYLTKRTPDIPKKDKSKGTPYENVAAGIGIFLFFSIFAIVFIMAFTIKFSWIKNIQLQTVPIILYVILATILFLRYLNSLGFIRKAHQDDLNFSNSAEAFISATWWSAIFSPFIFFVLLAEYFRQQNSIRRFTPPIDDAGKPMTRVDRDVNIDGTPYLSEGQRTEEKLNVYSYDIWLNADNSHLFKIIQQEGSKFSSHSKCPQCGFKTFGKPKLITLVRPSYTKQGQGKKLRRCVQCDFEELIGMVTIPMLVRNSDSSSSSSSGGSSSSSSSSSSYGGGSTGGGGSGGSW